MIVDTHCGTSMKIHTSSWMTFTTSKYMSSTKIAAIAASAHSSACTAWPIAFVVTPVDASNQIVRQARVRARSDVPLTSHRPGEVTRAVLGPGQRHFNPDLSSPMARSDVPAREESYFVFLCLSYYTLVLIDLVRRIYQSSCAVC
jgi:hypothetical protein